MQKKYPKTRLMYLGTWFILIWSISGFVFSAHSQNPFDIKSRKYIDSTKTKPQLKLPDTTPGKKDQESTVSLPSNNSSLLNPDTMASVNGNPDISSKPTDSQNTMPIDNSRLPEPGSIPAPSSADQQKLPLSPEIETLTEEVILSGQSDNALSWWYYVFDVVLLLVLVGAFLSDKNIFTPLRKAFVHKNFLRFLYRDTYLRKPGLFIYLNILFLLSFGFIIFRTAQYFGWASTFRDYLIIQGLVLFLFLLKHISLHLLSRLVDKPFDLKFYQYWLILSAGLIGLWMIPLALMISVLPHQYLSIALVIISIPVILLLLYRQMKAMLHAKFFLSKHFFQIFLYFCAVEIVPAVLLVDILVHY